MVAVGKRIVEKPPNWTYRIVPRPVVLHLYSLSRTPAIVPLFLLLKGAKQSKVGHWMDTGLFTGGGEAEWPNSARVPTTLLF